MKKPIRRKIFFKTYKQVPEVYEWRDVVSCFWSIFSPSADSERGEEHLVPVDGQVVGPKYRIIVAVSLVDGQVVRPKYRIIVAISLVDNQVVGPKYKIIVAISKWMVR